MAKLTHSLNEHLYTMLCLGDGCIVIDNVVSKKQCKFLTL